MRKPWVLAGLGMLAFCALVWFAGPQLSIGGQAPLASPYARTLLASAFIAQYILQKLWASGRARRANAQLVARLAPTPAAQAAADNVQLRERFTAALTQLRTQRFGARGGQWSPLSWRFGRAYVYQLPWYAIIGAPGSGKTTALLNAGLKFPLDEKLGRGPVAGFGGTRHCDWWFTDTAVLLDTAGRYTTQDSDRGADAGAWHAFLELLRQARPRRPLNGVLVAISVSDVLGFNEQQRAEHALTLRRRLDELDIALGIRPPVYVLITKCDLLPGFVDWFATAPRTERDAVWGVTFDLPRAKGHGANAPIAAQFAPRFNALVNRLADGLLQRLDSERDAQRRARVFALPGQVRNLSESLTALLAHAFDTPADGTRVTPFVRGVYLTSGTQEGTPIDRMLSALGRELGLQAHVLPPNQSTGRSFFLAQLLTDVVFAEAALSGHTPRRQRRRRRFVQVCMAAVGLAAIALALPWLDSYRHARAEIAALDATVVQLQSTLPVTRAADSDPRALLPALDALRSLSAAPADDSHRRAIADVGSGAALKLHAAARAAYDRMLLGPFQTTLANAVDATLRRGADVGVQYEALKTYAMLTDAAHFNAAGLKVFALSYWSTTLTPALSANELAHLEQHLDALLAAGAVGSGLRWDPALVSAVRARLASQPVAQRIALRIDVRLAQHPFADVVPASLGPAPNLFSSPADPSRAPAVIPGRYTLEAYRDLIWPQSPRIATELAAESSWVLGVRADGAADANEYLAAYRRDYAQAWAATLGALQFKASANNQEVLRQLQAVAVAHGTLAQWLAEIVRQIPAQLGDGIPGPIDAGIPAAAPLTALAHLVTPDGALSDALQRSLQELKTLRTPAADTASDAAPREQRLEALIADAQTQPAPVRSMLLALAVLPPSTAPRATSGAGLARQIAARLSVPCLKLVAGNFPFDRRANRDASLRDFAALFAPNGEYAAAFRDLLAGQVDIRDETWSARTAQGPDARDLERFRAAARIRSVFFAGNAPQPQLQLTFRPIDMDEQIDRFHLQIDGQNIDYAHGPTNATVIKWPGAHGSARIAVTPAAAGTALEYSGPWALLRLLDHAAIKESETPGHLTVVFEVGGRHASFQVDSASGGNPFRLRELEHVDCPLPGS